jgi:hypothetical protein
MVGPCDRGMETTPCNISKQALKEPFSRTVPTSFSSYSKHREQLRLYLPTNNMIYEQKKAPFSICTQARLSERGPLPAACFGVYVHLAPLSVQPSVSPQLPCLFLIVTLLLHCFCSSMPSQRPRLSCPQAWRRTCRGGGRRGRGSL